MAALMLAVVSMGLARSTRRVVFVTGDHEYSGEETMPLLALELEKNYRMKATVLKAYPDQNSETNIPGLEALAKADLAVFFLRWRQLPASQVAHIKAYLESGKPVMGFRTSSHAFNYPSGHALEQWNAFGAEAFGSPPGWGKDGHTHYGHESSTDVSVNPAAAGHPALLGVTGPFHVRSWLYQVLPKWPPRDAALLLMGKAVDPNKPAQENPVAWTWKNKFGGRVFFTTLGHPEDFKVEALQRLVINGIHWSLGLPVPSPWKGPFKLDAAYHGFKPAPVKPNTRK
ncbi:MAG: ThuA domain-containing protein [Acidobacteria bacterium]|nr:ThuA domain-containing protein [Acidobacteriota bacterium]MCI0626483.1 ThuA domain-containing protein [Acidobacteriota bacterium]MCI0717511.1 ThuA domain-containing protein [Acidobacteriota bacterium]